MLTIFELIPSFEYIKDKLCKNIDCSSEWELNFNPQVKNHSPESFVFSGRNNRYKVWLKFSLPSQIKEGQVLKDLAFSELNVPLVLYEEYKVNYDFLILSDIDGNTLSNSRNKLNYLPGIARNIACLQAYWIMNKKDYGDSSFRYIDKKEELIEGLNNECFFIVKNCIKILSQTNISLTHGDSTPHNWLISSNEFVPIDFKEITIGYSLLDIVQLLNPYIWSDSDPKGIYRREAIIQYTKTLQLFGIDTPWENNENIYLYAAWIIDRLRIINFYKRKIDIWEGNTCKYINPMFVNKKSNINEVKNNAIISTYWPKLF